MAQVEPLERLSLSSLSSSASPRPRSSSCVSGCGDPFIPEFSVTILEGLGTECNKLLHGRVRNCFHEVRGPWRVLARRPVDVR